jgi:hypothetical protein
VRRHSSGEWPAWRATSTIETPFGDGPEALDHGTEFLAFGGGQLFVESVGPEAKDVGHVGFDLHLANLARGA